MEIRVGKLGIQCPELMANSFGGFVNVKEVYKKVKDTDYGRQVIRDVSDDPRIQSLLNQSVMMGSAYNPLNIDSLIEWYLWRINNVGKDIASNELEFYLDSDAVPSVTAVWVSGLKVEF